MDTIISIDMDIVMSPYCGIYNNLVNPSIDRQYNWESIIQNEFNTQEFILNQEYYDQIIDIIKHYAPKVDKIYIGYDHSTILRAIELEKENLDKNYRFNLYNIDYHHDVSYAESQDKMIIDSKFAVCANWVGFLNYYNCLNSYSWYKGIGSNKILSENKEINPMPMFIHTLNNNFPYGLENVKILYITLSMPWIPLHLTNELGLSFIEKIKNIKDIYYLDGSYSLNNNRLHFLNKI